MKRIFLSLLLLAFAWPAAAQDGPDKGTITKVGTTSAQMLKLGVGARAAALGGAFVGEASDLSAAYWNAAGLSWLDGSEVMLAHTEYIAGVNYSHAAFGMNLGRSVGTVAVSLTFLDSGNMEVRTERQPGGTGEQFDFQSMALQLNYARALTDQFSIGGAVKYVRESIWHSSASAVAVDIGTLFTTPFERLRLGASISNFGPKMTMDGRDITFSEDPDGVPDIVNAKYLLDAHPMPLVFRVGLALDAYEDANNRVLVLIDAAHPNDNSEYVNLGLEYSFRNLFALRGGYKNLFETDGDVARSSFTFGGGLNVRLDRSLRFGANYAYADFGLLEETHWFTIHLGF